VASSTTCLITGGAGNLACQLARMIHQRGDRAVLFDIAPAPATDPGPGAAYVRGDITDPAGVDAVIAEHRPGVVIHFASLLSGSTEARRDLGWRVNMDGAFFLLEAALRHGVEQVFFPSSVAAYGGTLPDPVPPDHPQWPDGLYGVTKAAVERLGHYYHARHGLDFRAIRVPVVISPFAPAGAASAYASRAFVESVHDGRFTFKVREATSPSVIYVRDILAAVLQLLDAPAARLTRRVYNLQALSPTAGQIADAIAQRLPDAALRFEPEDDVVKLIESWPVCFDDAAARRDWGWAPRYDLPALADDMIASLQNRPH